MVCSAIVYRINYSEQYRIVLEECLAGGDHGMNRLRKNKWL